MPRFAANLTLLFTELPFLERFAAARKAGFDGVEYLFPYDWAPDELAARLTAERLTQVLFNLPAGDWAAGERGIACHPDRTEEFRTGVEQALVYARALDCPRVNCLAGIAPAGLSPDECWSTLVDNVRWAADRFATAGRTLCVEAINSRVDIPGFLLDSSARAALLLRDVDRPNVKFQYDLYHMQIMEGDLIRTLERMLPQVGHIQFADNPGRHEPGTGEINLAGVFRAIDAMGYDGWVSAEYHPLSTTTEGLGWLDAAESRC